MLTFLFHRNPSHLNCDELLDPLPGHQTWAEPQWREAIHVSVKLHYPKGQWFTSLSMTGLFEAGWLIFLQYYIVAFPSHLSRQPVG